MKHIGPQNSSKDYENPSIGFIRLKIVEIDYWFAENGYWLPWIGLILLLALVGPRLPKNSLYFIDLQNSSNDSKNAFNGFIMSKIVRIDYWFADIGLWRLHFRLRHMLEPLALGSKKTSLWDIDL